MAPRTCYARNADVSIAYQVVGEGPDLLWIPGFISHLDVYWADPDIARMLRLVADFCRLIIYDKRGTGLSDPVWRPPTLDERVGDALAVLDAAGSTEAAVVGFSEGAPTGMLLAARYPTRIPRLVLYGAIILGVAEESRPWGVREETYEALFSAIDEWGEGRTMEVLAPSVVPGGFHQKVWGAIERSCASPSMARATVEAWRTIDLEQVIPSIAVPTVVVHRRGDAFPLAAGQYVAEHLAGARLVELEGADHLPWIGDADPIVAEIRAMVTGSRGVVDPGAAFTTVMFTDIVGSTALAAALGDVAWRSLLERHRAVVHAEVTAAGGRLAQDTGDGFLVIFEDVGRALGCAHALIGALAELDLQIRVGIHCGVCQMLDGQPSGVTVHIGARVCALARPGEVLVTEAVVPLAAGGAHQFGGRGSEVLKGVPGRWRLLSARPRPVSDSDGRPGAPADWLRPRDRAFLAVAAHLPSSIRLGGRLTRRWRPPAPVERDGC
jgi:pimeloyl-ACP methyl ester carboxylesterase